MQALQTFNFNSQSIKLQKNDGQIWFCGADVARAIGYRNPAQAIADNVSPKYRQLLDLEKRGRKPVFISEVGFYELIIKSRYPLNNPG
ncbi:BRO family protein [Microcoleus sp. B3-D7]|uniref:BRO family protein n=1 Tax=Microcoleus sp. B3-D7 TaxID=2818659 RepID=UPI002FCF051F